MSEMKYGLIRPVFRNFSKILWEKPEKTLRYSISCKQSLNISLYCSILNNTNRGQIPLKVIEHTK